MKRIIAFACVTLAVVGLVALCLNTKTDLDKENFLRIHIRADSNDAAAQQVKYKVKNALIDFLTPYLAEVKTKRKATETVQSLLSKISDTATAILRQNGFEYAAKAVVKREVFPTRSYDGFTLKSGEYDALIVNLGSGKGDNWWCVVYPPLCFLNGESTGSGKTEYKSLIKEIIDDFAKRRQK